MKTVVLYRSKSGFVKKYAGWIAEALSADIFEAAKVTANIFDSYDIVIYGGGLYAVGINGVKLITKNLDKLEGKKVVVFASGASPSKEETINEIINKNFSTEQQEKIDFFYLRGGFDYSKLKPIDKVLMNLLSWSIKKKVKQKKNLTDDETGMLALLERPADFTNKSNINEIVAYVKSLA